MSNRLHGIQANLTTASRTPILRAAVLGAARVRHVSQPAKCSQGTRLSDSSPTGSFGHHVAIERVSRHRADLGGSVTPGSPRPWPRRKPGAERLRPTRVRRRIANGRVGAGTRDGKRDIPKVCTGLVDLGRSVGPAVRTKGARWSSHEHGNLGRPLRWRTHAS